MDPRSLHADVVGVITPLNNPAFMSAIKVIPALEAGCTIIHKAADSGKGL